jgi:hypothetical protein
MPYVKADPTGPPRMPPLLHYLADFVVRFLAIFLAGLLLLVIIGNFVDREVNRALSALERMAPAMNMKKGP